MTITKRTFLSLLALLASNVTIPLVGIGVFHWSPTDMLFAFWSENIVIGLYTIGRLHTLPDNSASFRLTVNGQPRHYTGSAAKHLSSFFFFIHFGGFTAIHGIFLLAFFGTILNQTSWTALLSGFLFLCLSHGVSFIEHDLRRTGPAPSVNSVFLRPYLRILPVHLAVTSAGTFLIDGAYSPTTAIFWLVGIKLSIDIIAHMMTHSAHPPKNTDKT